MNIEPPSCGFPPQPYPLKGHPRLREDTFGTRAQVLPMRRLSGGAMLCHLQCARFANRRRIAGVRPSLPEALTRSPPVAAPTTNKRPSGIGEFVFVTLTGLRGFSRLTYPAERRYFDEEQERHSARGCVAYFPYVSSRGRVPDAVIRKIAPFSSCCGEYTSYATTRGQGGCSVCRGTRRKAL